MPATSTNDHAGGALIETRRRADYTAAERAFSLFLSQRLHDLLEGKCNSLPLLRRYPGQADRLGIITTPPGLRRDDLRLSTVEKLALEVLNFVNVDATGGPIAQSVEPDGSILERQTFPTKYPHVVIERTDRYPNDGEESVEVTWYLRRVQNQRVQTQINRVLDVLNLGIELARFVG